MLNEKREQEEKRKRTAKRIISSFDRKRDGFEWKCGNCGALYSTEDFKDLKMVPAKEGDPDPKKNYGYAPVCDVCGYIFHREKWMVKTKVTFFSKEIGEINAEVSTVFLELNHHGLWYETMIFAEGENVECDYQTRYANKNQAKDGHARLLEKIKKGEYKVIEEGEEIKSWVISIC